MNAVPQPVLIHPETYRRVHDCLQCDECGATTALPRLGLRHKLGCHATGGIRALTRREQQIALMLADGKNVNEISAELGIAHKTVHSHRTMLYRRLGIKKITQLMDLLYISKLRIPKEAK